MSAECEAAHDEFLKPVSRMGLAVALAQRGEVDAARAVADTALETAAGLDEYFQGMGHAASATTALAAGDVGAAHDAGERAWECLSVAQPQIAAVQRAFNTVDVAAAEGDLALARRMADEAVSVATGWHQVTALWPVPASRSPKATSKNPGVMPMMRSPAQPAPGRTCPLADILECLAHLAVAAEVGRRPDFSVRPRRSGSAWGSCGSRSIKPITRFRS